MTLREQAEQLGADDELSPFLEAGDLQPGESTESLTPDQLEAQRKADAAFATLSIDGWLSSAERRLEEGVELIPTGWERLDAALGGGLLVPSLTMLGAGPKSFKSTFAQILATRHVERGGVAYYLDLENGRHRFLRQMLCRRAQLGPKAVAAALKDERRGVFQSREAVKRWTDAKAWLRDRLRGGLFVEFTPPKDLESRIAAARRAAGPTHRLLVVIDSLQKLPMDLSDRRAAVDGHVRMFEKLRHQHDAAFFVVSEIKRDFRGGYTPNESAFKESGGIEYAADLAMTLTRPRADEDEEAVSTLRVELARDCEEDPRGDVASYAALRPYYGLEERDPAERSKGKRGPKAKKLEAAREFLLERLSGGRAEVADTVIREGVTAGIASKNTIREAAKELGVLGCTVNLKSGWRLP